jgi:hypothetical protein
MDQTTLDQEVRRQVYQQAMSQGRLALANEVAIALSISREEVQASFQRLAGGRVLVLQPENGEILMANPFSAVPTPFLAQTSEHSYYGNCIWDALGIPAMLHQDVLIQASCGDCGLSMQLEVTGGRLKPASGVVHFAIPAAHWWDEIVVT